MNSFFNGFRMSMSHFWNQVWVKLFVALSKAHIPISCYLFSQQGMFAYSLPCCGTVCGISLWYIYSSCFFSSVVLWQFDSRIALKCLRSVSSVFIRSIYGRYVLVLSHSPEWALWTGFVVCYYLKSDLTSSFASVFNVQCWFDIPKEGKCAYQRDTEWCICTCRWA